MLLEARINFIMKSKVVCTVLGPLRRHVLKSYSSTQYALGRKGSQGTTEPFAQALRDRLGNVKCRCQAQTRCKPVTNPRLQLQCLPFFYGGPFLMTMSKVSRMSLAISASPVRTRTQTGILTFRACAATSSPREAKSTTTTYILACVTYQCYQRKAQPPPTCVFRFRFVGGEAYVRRQEKLGRGIYRQES